MPPSDPPPLDRSESLVQRVARNVRNDIDAGVLRHGEALPSTRALAERWGVSVFTINEAMRLLADEGLVISKSRSSRVVSAPGQSDNPIRTTKPHAILVGGYAGTGKTALGRILARETGWPMLDKDTLTRPVVETALELAGRSPHDRESEFYLNTIRPREYEALSAALQENLECGNSAIVTAPFIKEFNDAAWLKRAQAANTALNATTTFVWVYCDAETMQSYIRHRGAARDAAKLADWKTYLEGVNVDFRPDVPHAFIDNCASSTPLQAQARDLVEEVLSGAAT